MGTDTTISVALIALVISTVCSLINLFRGGSKDSKEDVRSRIEQNVKVNMKLDQLCTTTTEIRTDQKSMSTEVSEIREQQTIIKNSVDTLWKRYDELKQEIHELKEIDK